MKKFRDEMPMPNDNTPGDEDKQFMLLSSKCPSGTTWLLNIFLELNIKIYRAGNDYFWQKISNSEYKINDSQRKELVVHLPTLSDKNIFEFPEKISVFWAHEWPNEGNLSRPLILYLRHGKDAVYSHYKRSSGTGLQFTDFLRKPLYDDSNPISYQMHLPPAEYWALYCILWKRLADDHCLLIKFEDMRCNPENELNKILDFLQIQRDLPNIKNALDQSTFERTRTVEEKNRSTQYHKQAVMNRRGKVEEYKEIYTARENQFFSGLPDYALVEFGYLTRDDSPTDIKKQPKQDTFFIALKEEFDLSEQKGVSIHSVLTRAAASFTGEMDDAITLGKVLSCYEWASSFFGQESYEGNYVRKIMHIFLDIIPYFENRPLILISAAGALAKNGRKDLAGQILDSVLIRNDIHYFEKTEAGIELVKIGARLKARNVLLSAVTGAPNQDEVTALDRRLAAMNEKSLLEPNLLLFFVKNIMSVFQRYTQGHTYMEKHGSPYVFHR